MSTPTNNVDIAGCVIYLIENINFVIIKANSLSKNSNSKINAIKISRYSIIERKVVSRWCETTWLTSLLHLTFTSLVEIRIRLNIARRWIDFRFSRRGLNLAAGTRQEGTERKRGAWRTKPLYDRFFSSGSSNVPARHPSYWTSNFFLSLSLSLSLFLSQRPSLETVKDLSLPASFQLHARLTWHVERL